MIRRLTTLVLALAVALPALPVLAADGMTVVTGQHGVAETEQRLLAALDEAGMTVIARVDHAAAARGAGLELAPTRLVIFGNPKVGTRLMQCGRSVAIDLPMKMLIWEDTGATRIGYNTSDYLTRRHGIEGCGEVPAKVAGALERFARQAAGE